MTKIIAPQTNCWSAFLSSLLDADLSETEPCSTDHDDWKEQTDRFLAKRGLCYIETDPRQCTGLPDQYLVGAQVNRRRPHIVIAKVLAGESGVFRLTTFQMHHDPSGVEQVGELIDPNRIVLFIPRKL